MAAQVKKQQDIISVTDADTDIDSNSKQSKKADLELNHTNHDCDCGDEHDTQSDSPNSRAESHYNHVQTAYLQKILFMISFASFFFLVSILFTMQNEIKDAVTKFVDDNIERQNF